MLLAQLPEQTVELTDSQTCTSSWVPGLKTDEGLPCYHFKRRVHLNKL